MLTFDAALDEARLALTTLPELRSRPDLVILQEHIRERGSGWLFPYDTARFAQTERPEDGVIGYGPLFVDKNDGSVHLLPTARIDAWLDEYDRTGAPPAAEPPRWRWIGSGPMPAFLPADFDVRRPRHRS